MSAQDLVESGRLMDTWQTEWSIIRFSWSLTIHRNPQVHFGFFLSYFLLHFQHASIFCTVN